jgi:hypothetical protein
MFKEDNVRFVVVEIGSIPHYLSATTAIMAASLFSVSLSLQAGGRDLNKYQRQVNKHTHLSLCLFEGLAYYTLHWPGRE